MQKKEVVFSFVIVSFFLLACSPEGDSSEGNSSLSLNASVDMNEESNEKLKEVAGEKLPTDCEEGWFCPSERHRAFHYGNCTTRNLERCDYGCLNGSCQKRAFSNLTCVSGFKCKNANTKAFQLESCSWESSVACEFGCENGKCLPKPNETISSSEGTVEEDEQVRLSYTIIKPGEEQQLGNHTLKIYLLDFDKVRILVDGLRSDWLEEGMNATFSTGITVIIGEILFQSYEGGVRHVSYVVQ